MRFVVAATITAIVGFFAFQNCQKSPHADDLGSGVHPSAQNSVFKLSDVKLNQIDFNFTESENIERSGQQYTLDVNKKLEISLYDGKMALRSDTSDQVERYCLTETLHLELVQILKNAEICKSGPAEDGKLCTQALRMPYAVLHTEKESIDLGGASDGCGSNSTDLCGDEVKHIQGFWAHIKPNIRSYKCP